MSSVYHAISVHSSRRPTELKDSDYDHEIRLIDHTQPAITTTATRSRSHSASEGSRRDSLSPPDEDSARRHSDDVLRKKLSLREELARRRYTKPKYQDRRLGDDLNEGQPQEGEVVAGNIIPEGGDAASDDGRPQTGESSELRRKSTQIEQESAIDVLYENERGCFLCGMPLFSSKALGAADAPPWTNAAQKASATDIKNAQVPDPSWEWAWPEWRIYHSDKTDPDGWEYSFMFSKKKLKFSWHGPTWYNSFVRRRAWIRKRVKKGSGYQMQEAHQLNSDYFTVRPSISHSRSPSKAPSVNSRYSIAQLAKRDMEEEVDKEDIRDIGSLMKALKESRIDRERMEAVENFIKNGGDELYYLKDHMSEIMSQFIFQASRRLLLAHLSKIYNDASEQREQSATDGEEESAADKRRLANLEAAIKAAEEQVKRLEFWSDIKGLVEQGDVEGAVDESKGWNEKKWAGLDDSGPKGAVADRDLPRKSSKEIELESRSISGKGKEKA
jgi:hypothetical protein